MAGCTLFATPLGACAIAWGEQGVLGLWLPDADEAATRQQVRRRHPGLPEATPPAGLQRGIAAIVGLLNGAPNDLRGLALDLRGLPAFHVRVYAAAREIDPGRTLTYGELAQRVGEPGAARAVGRALGDNPFPLIVPCHRILAAQGQIGGFSAPGGELTKRRLLQIERAPGFETPDLFDAG